MQLISHKLPSDIDLYLSGDWHFGNALMHLSGFRKMRDDISNNKIGFLFGMGDVADAITHKDKRYNRETDGGMLPLEQYQLAVKELKSLARKGKILGLLAGNHDLTIEQFGNVVEGLVCPDLGVPYGTYTSKLIIKDKSGRPVGIQTQ